MKVLSVQSFADALTKCNDNQRYKVCIVFESTVTYIQFISEVRQLHSINPIPGVTEVYADTSSSARIMFHNGSCVEVFVLRENKRGIRCDEILYDYMIDADNLLEFLNPYLYRTGILEDSSEDVFDEAEELDKFLNGFRIVDEVG